MCTKLREGNLKGERTMIRKQVFVTGYIRKVTAQGLYEFVTYDNIDAMFCDISKIYCFDDYDDTYEIVDIFVNGRRVEYVGWLPGLHFEYIFVDNRELAWEGWFDHWEH
jgi:hypothetical protein